MKHMIAKIQSFLHSRGLIPKRVFLWTLVVVAALAVCIGVDSLVPGGGRVFPVYISEVMASNTSYPNEDGRCCDFIELHNSADYPVDLTGFQLGDVTGSSRYAFAAGTVMAADSYLVVYCDKTVEEPGYAPFEISRSGGERFYLIASNNAVADKVVTIAMDVDQSMILQEGQWVASGSVTPGMPNDAANTGYQDIYNSGISPVRISEFSAAETGYAEAYGALCDWVELYNTSSSRVDLSGFTLSDNVGNDKYRFPAGTAIEANSYLVVLCTDRVTDSAIAPFSLSRAGEETVVLKDSRGRIVEIVRTMAMEQGSMAVGEDGSWRVTEKISAGYDNTRAGHEAYLQSIGAVEGVVRISEVMSAAQMMLPDRYGEFSDWVELHNTADHPVNLAGWCLSDDPEDPQKWMFPELTIGPGAYAVVFCSGRDMADSREVHTGFGLSAGGESLTLTSYIGNVVDAVSFPALEENCAFVFGNGAQPEQTYYPTPGYSNDDAGYTAFCASRTAEGPLAIWEVMTSNDWYLPQKLGECYDWVELRNISDEPLNLAGFSISDDTDVPDMHVLPDITLQPGQTVAIILSGQENMAKDGYDHAMFTLDAQEDQLLLYDRNGNLLDYVFIRDIPAGCSYGRSEETGGFQYMEPTPENPNIAGYTMISAEPVSSHVPGVYTGDERYTVTLEGEGTIYYTTDGSIPDAASAKYEQPLQIDKTMVLRAVSIEPGKMASDPYTATFVIGQVHDLPIVSLVTDPDGLWGANGVYKNGDLSVKEQKLASNVAYKGTDGSFSLDCEMSLHGITTVTEFDKKSFKIRFRDNYDGILHYDVFNDGEVTAFRSLILRTSYEGGASTQMHDALINYVASQGSDKVICQKYKYVALYLNGEYWGLYAIREHHSESHYASYMNVPADSVQIVRYTTHQRCTLEDFYYFCEKNSLVSDENYAYAKSVLDMESFADWVIYEAYMCNVDIYANIRYYQSMTDGVWYLGLADLDLGMVGIHRAFDELANTFHHGLFVRKLMENEEFQDLLATRLAELLAGPLSDANMIATIEHMKETVQQEAVLEQARWGTSVRAWESSVDSMIRFCDGRSKEMIDSLCAQLNFTQQEREAYFGHLE